MTQPITVKKTNKILGAQELLNSLFTGRLGLVGIGLILVNLFEGLYAGSIVHGNYSAMTMFTRYGVHVIISTGAIICGLSLFPNLIDLFNLQGMSLKSKLRELLEFIICFVGAIILPIIVMMYTLRLTGDLPLLYKYHVYSFAFMEQFKEESFLSVMLIAVHFIFVLLEGVIGHGARASVTNPKLSKPPKGIIAKELADKVDQRDANISKDEKKYMYYWFERFITEYFEGTYESSFNIGNVEHTSLDLKSALENLRAEQVYVYWKHFRNALRDIETDNKGEVQSFKFDKNNQLDTLLKNTIQASKKGN